MCNEMISVIITTYNRSMKILSRAINSVCNQTYKNYEIIIINDYPDNKYEIDCLIKSRYNSFNIRVEHNESNIGACRSRNKGIKMATGNWIAFLDDDDEWIDNKLEVQIEYAMLGYSLVYCTGTIVYDSGNIDEMPFIKDCAADPIGIMLCDNCMGGCSFPLLEKKMLYELGGFDEKLKSSQDYDLWLRIICKYNFCYINQSLVKYHISDDSITSDTGKRMQGYLRILKKYKYLYKKNPKSLAIFGYRIYKLCIINREYKYILLITKYLLMTLF